MSLVSAARQIRVLLLEDSRTDAEIVVRALKQAGFEPDWTRVDTEHEFWEAVNDSPELIISDYALPQFDGILAVQMLRERDLDIPFILISGTLGEELAVTSIKHGADDYLLKGQLARLGPAVNAALNSKRLRDERSRAEVAERIAQNRLLEFAATQSAILNALPAHVALLNADGVIVNVNETWQHAEATSILLGPVFSEGQNYLAICNSINCDDSIAIAAGIRRVLAGHLREFSHEYSCQSKDGTQWFQLIVNALQDAESTGVVVMHIDITKRKQAEEKLRQSQKMEAVSQLSGGIAHDLNNLLTIIDGYATLLQLENRLPETSLDYLREIQTASSRAMNFIKRLLAFGRQYKGAPEVLDVNSVVDETLQMLAPLIHHNIIRDITREKDLWLIRADRGQVSQILINLLLNARDAMPNGGRLAVETQNVEISELNASAEESGHIAKYIMIRVADSGCGMTTDVQQRIFDPFYTTKPIGKGTGLGLSTVHNIVTQYGGRIELSSSPGNGAVFQVFLPQVNESTSDASRTLVTTPQQRRSETILLVEDDNNVRRLTCSILKRYGYEVLETPDAAGAIQICKQHDQPIQLLLTDFVLAGTDGADLAAEIVQIAPAIRVLFMSGFIPEHRRHQLLGQSNILDKPFTHEELESKIRSILDS